MNKHARRMKTPGRLRRLRWQLAKNETRYSIFSSAIKELRLALFTDKLAAHKLVARLTQDERGGGLSYDVTLLLPDTYAIRVTDENGEFIGYL